ncbi:gp58-like family protein [Streptococcus dysgalactiae]|uniref:Gp58-like family protein n=1 Tax=Streptococcus dysgalactiae TaxID=1334 RepID=A0AAE9UP92_STRDY|nr:gp58-like family protein [Streptococcus dysgalactiae]WAI93955.1 gp58-like family protein [Streptococcus dysgalactiae]
MSRDPTITLDESNLVIGPDGRVHYTFTAEDDNQKVRLASNCLGTAHFNQLMIERGDTATSYVAPVVVEGTGNPTGLFKDLKEISLELTDTENSNLWSKIKLTNRGMLQEYYDGKIKTEIVNSARGVATRISEDTDKKLALINDTVDGIRREYQDADRKLSASYQAGIEGLKATMRDDKLGLQAEIKASAQGLSQKYDDELRKLSAKITTTSSGTTEAYENKLEGLRAEFTRSNQGMRTELESQISGLRATQQSTASQISQEIHDRTGAVSRVQQDLSSYQRRLQDTEKNYSSLTQTVRGLQSDVGDPSGKIQSRFTQLAGQIEQRVTRDGVMSIISGAGDSIKLAIQKAGGINTKMSGSEIISAINLNAYGAVIAGKNIALDGNTTVNGTFTTKIAEAIKIRADQIIAGTIDAAKIRVINLNASSIVGLDADFIKARIGYAIVDMLEGKVIRARNGAMLIDLNTAKMDFNSSATINFNNSQNALMRKKGESTAFVHFNDDSYGGVYVGVGVTSNYEGVKSQYTSRFAGMRVFRSNDQNDQLELYGDKIIMSHGFEQGGSLIIKFSDFAGKDINLATVFDMIFDNFRNLNDVGGNYSRSYYANWR